MKEEKRVSADTRPDKPGKIIPRAYDEGVRLTVQCSDAYECHCDPRQQDPRD
jgi:hypothetical protein